MKKFTTLFSLVCLSAWSQAAFANAFYAQTFSLKPAEEVKLSAAEIQTFDRASSWKGGDNEICPGTGIQVQQYGFLQDSGPASFLISEITTEDDRWASQAAVVEEVPFNAGTSAITAECLSGSVPVLKIRGIAITASSGEKPATLQVAFPSPGKLSLKIFLQ